MTNNDIKRLLLSKKSVDRIKAAKEIGKQHLTDFSDLLVQCYLNESKKDNNWKIVVQLILAIGLVEYKPALNTIFKIIKENKPHDMVTYAAAQTYVRLKRYSLKDISPIIDLLKFGGLSVADGSLNPLAYDKMQPENKDILQLFQICWNLHEHKDRIGLESGFTDPRYGLAAACAFWDKDIVKPFLQHCLNTSNNDSSLIYVAKSALSGKIPKLR